jgi:Reverse transcriptase (RNA-dependent DNA polymerase)
MTTRSYIFLDQVCYYITPAWFYQRKINSDKLRIEFASFVIDQMEDGVQIDSIYTDFSKAFDKVNHRILLKKLHKLRFSGKFLAWIGSYLTNRKQYVKTCGSRSCYFTVRSGDPHTQKKNLL